MEYHVSVNGSDSNDGTLSSPLRTISAAAIRAMPGDIVTVHQGTYREWISPPRGGESDERRIVYRAAEGELVEIKGSEIVDGWRRVADSVWQVTLPNTFFGDYNPYADRIRGDWFDGRGREHHTGQVYINGQYLIEAASLDDVLTGAGERPMWYGKVDDKTTLWVYVKDMDLSQQLVEIHVRPAVFYPKRPGINFITVRGFVLRHAATQWAPPTTEQIGLIGTHWSQGWIIEENTISDSRCTGITLGKYGGNIDDTGATADRYNQTIREALASGWQKGSVGHHIVRNNTIYNCEQAGIAGSLGAAFSEVSGNHIHHIHVERLFSGAEMAGIKFHGPIDTIISKNRIHDTHLGIWLDWMAQGTRVRSNVLYDNRLDLFVEVSHGPLIIDHNLFLSDRALLNWSQGTAFIHNLFAGEIVQRAEKVRLTPYNKPHSTEVAGLSNIKGGDDRYYNNIFVGSAGLSTYDKEEPNAFPVWMDGNVYCSGAQPSQHETSPVELPGPFRIEVVTEETSEGESLLLEIDAPSAWQEGLKTRSITAEMLGIAQVPGLPFVDSDDASLSLRADYRGRPRVRRQPLPGPFEHLEAGVTRCRVWP